MERSGPIRVGLFLTSLSLLLGELVLTRIFSVTLGHHFAFLVISIAVFGLSLAGVIVYLRPQSFPPERLLEQAARFSSWMVPALIVLLASALVLPVRATSAPADVALMGVLYLLASVPFVLGGLVITLIVTHRARDIARMYFADLLGAGAGALLTIPVVNLFGGPTALLVAAVVAGSAALVFSVQSMATDRATGWLLAPIGLAAGAGLLGFGVFGEALIEALARGLFHADPTYTSLTGSFASYYSLFQADVRDSLTGLAVLGGVLLVGAGAAHVGWRRRWGRTLLWSGLCLGLALSAVAVNLSYTPLRIRYAKGSFEPPRSSRAGTPTRASPSFRTIRSGGSSPGA